MPTLNVTTPDGRNASVQVGDNFASLSQEQQASTVEEIAKSIPGDSWSGDVKGGLHDLGTALSQGANTLGYAGVGKTIQDYTPDAPPGPAPSASLANDLRSGNYRGALSELPHSVLRSLPSVAPILAGGALGGPVGAGIAAGAEAYGPTAYSRAAANGTTPQQERLSALPGAAAQGVLGSVLPGGAASKIASPVLRAGAKAALQAGAGAGMDLANQVGSTAGTARGLSVDPYETAGAGLTQGAFGAARGAREVAGAGVKAGADRIMASQLTPPTDTAQAASVERVGQAMDNVAATAGNASGKPLPPTVIANNVKDLYVDRLTARARALMLANQIDKSDFNQLINTIDGAQRHNNTVSPVQMSHIAGLGLDPDTTQSLQNDVTDLNTVSSQSFQKNETGPFRMLGSGLGRVAGVGAALLSHDPTAIVGSLIGQRLEGKIGGAIGGAVDRFMGTNTPPVVLQRLNAQRMLGNRDITTPQPPLPEPYMAPPKDATPAFGLMRQAQAQAQAPAAPNQSTPAFGLMRQAQAQAAARAASSQPSPGPIPPAINLNALKAKAAQIQAQRDANSGTVTGLPPNPVPVNTPIPANGGPPMRPPVPSAPQLPAFQPHSPSDVASALATDDMAARALPVALQRPNGAPAPTPVVPPPGTPQPPLGGALGYIARGMPQASPDEIRQRLQVGLPADEFARLDAAPMVTDKAAIQRYRQIAAGQAAGGGNHGYAVEHSEQARVNAAGYQMFALQAMKQAAAAGEPELANAIRAVALEKTIDGKKALAQAFEATHPGKQIPPELLKQGKK